MLNIYKTLSKLEYKWIVGIIFVFALFMDLLDITIVNVALPTFAKDFHAGTTGIEWVITGYLVSLAIFIPISGWAGDRFGTKRTFIFALAVFVLGSFLCGLARNIQSLVAFRILQGMGGGMLTPVGVAMLFRAFPPQERAKASAILIIPTVIAPASGPILGGYLVQYHSWEWIFRVNVPIGILGLITAWIFLKEEKQPDTGKLDTWGFILSAAGLSLILYALTEAANHGFTYSRVIIFLPAGLALLTIFVFLELHIKNPIIHVRLLTNRIFRTTNIVQLVALGGLLGTLFLLPLLLQQERGLSPLQSGLTTFPQAVGVILMTQPATMLYRRFGPRRLMIFGMTGALLTNLAFQLTDLQTSLWWIRLIVLLQGSSLVFVFISLQTAGFATIENRDQGHASAIFNAVRQVGSSLGVALAAFVLTNRLTSHNAKLGDTATQSGALSAFHSAFLAGGIIIGLGIIASFFIVDKDAEVTMQSVKEKETQSIPKTSLEPVVDPVTVPADDHPSEENENIEDERLKNSVEIDRKSDTETGII